MHYRTADAACWLVACQSPSALLVQDHTWQSAHRPVTTLKCDCSMQGCLAGLQSCNALQGSQRRRPAAEHVLILSAVCITTATEWNLKHAHLHTGWKHSEGCTSLCRLPGRPPAQRCAAERGAGQPPHPALAAAGHGAACQPPPSPGGSWHRHRLCADLAGHRAGGAHLATVLSGAPGGLAHVIRSHQQPVESWWWRD